MRAPFGAGRQHTAPPPMIIPLVITLAILAGEYGAPLVTAGFVLSLAQIAGASASLWR